MIFGKLDRLMSEIIDFADSNVDSTILYHFIEKAKGPAEIRTHDLRIRFQHNNIQRSSDHGYSAS
jgi:hypothetical protein